MLPVSNSNYQLVTGNTGIGNISTLATLTPTYSFTLTRRKNEAGETSGVTVALALLPAVRTSDTTRPSDENVDFRSLYLPLLARGCHLDLPRRVADELEFRWPEIREAPLRGRKVEVRRPPYVAVQDLDFVIPCGG